MIGKVTNLKEAAIACLRFGRECYVCNNSDLNNLSLDHFYPKSLGGKDSDFVVLCIGCNSMKGNKPPEEFFSKRLYNKAVKSFQKSFSDEEILAELKALAQLELDEALRLSKRVNVSPARIAFLYACLNRTTAERKVYNTAASAKHTDKVKKLRSQGFNFSQISRKLGISIPQVRKYA